ncbi:DAZ-associated protein [Reticulomyxa filosa]|uniref:DAZ-associated protein n=1 Tax=Reticulomyxa filosa TaxID=46433 RepID=X6LSB4_RETFI|nr:DAZ-associated protein [Reticulomyxa filosa]|eukprot:ETO04002.1 DAZ-associated protein [Reticulomyxa filosa]
MTSPSSYTIPTTVLDPSGSDHTNLSVPTSYIQPDSKPQLLSHGINSLDNDTSNTEIPVTTTNITDPNDAVSDKHSEERKEEPARSPSVTAPPRLIDGRRHDEVFNPRKLFVGNLPKNIRTSRFREYWEKFGPLEDCIVIKEQMTNENRGFGFVVFENKIKNKKKLETVLKLADTLEIDGKKKEILGKIIKSKEENTKIKHNLNIIKSLKKKKKNLFFSLVCLAPVRLFNKLFVGSLPDSVTAEQLTDLFKKFGNIIDSVVMYDAEGRSRRFGFVTFEDSRNCDRVLSAGPHFIGKNKLAIERAVPKRDMDMVRMEEEPNKYAPYYNTQAQSTYPLNTGTTAPAYHPTYTSMPYYDTSSSINGTALGYSGMYATNPTYYGQFYDTTTFSEPLTTAAMAQSFYNGASTNYYLNTNDTNKNTNTNQTTETPTGVC